MNISKWISLLQNRNQHSSIRKGKDIKVYCNTEEDRVNEGKTGGRQTTWGTQTWRNFCLTWPSAHNPSSFRTWTSQPSAPSLQNPPSHDKIKKVNSSRSDDLKRHKLNKWSLRGITTWIARCSKKIDRTLAVVLIKFQVLISMLMHRAKNELLINPPQLLYHSSNTYNVIN